MLKSFYLDQVKSTNFTFEPLDVAQKQKQRSRHRPIRVHPARTPATPRATRRRPHVSILARLPPANPLPPPGPCSFNLAASRVSSSAFCAGPHPLHSLPSEEGGAGGGEGLGERGGEGWK